MSDPTSIERTHFVDRPISEDSFSVNVLFGYETPHTAVVGLIAVIAQNIVVSRLDIDWRICSMVQIFGQDVVLIKRLVIDVHDTAPDFDDIARHSDDALDVRLRGIERIPKHDDILTLNLFDPVNELVNENTLLVDQFG